MTFWLFTIKGANLRELEITWWKSRLQHFQQKNVFMICGKLSHIDMLYKYYIISVKLPKAEGGSSVKVTLRLRHKPEKARIV